MNSSINRKKISSSTELFHSNQEEEMLKNRRRLFDMNEIKRAKIFRNEVIYFTFSKNLRLGLQLDV
jgi:hypothetical protein